MSYDEEVELLERCGFSEAYARKSARYTNGDYSALLLEFLDD